MVITTTKYDAWRRVVDVQTSGPDLSSHETYSYRADGRLDHSTREQGRTSPVTVTTSYTYDLAGRTLTTAVDNVQIAGASATQTTATSYNIPSHTITTSILPGGAVTTATIDDLGRTVSTSTDPGAGDPTPIETAYAYDLAGNIALQADNFIATAFAYDAFDRRIATLRQDGTKSITDHDAWGHTTEATTFDASATPNVVSHEKSTVLPAGTVQQTVSDVSVATQQSAAIQQTIDFGWDCAGRTTSIASSGPTAPSRASHALFDVSGRMTLSSWGGGSVNNVTDAFSNVVPVQGSFSGTLPTQLTTSEHGARVSFSRRARTTPTAQQHPCNSVRWRGHSTSTRRVTSRARNSRIALSRTISTTRAARSRSRPFPTACRTTTSTTSAGRSATTPIPPARPPPHRPTRSGAR